MDETNNKPLEGTPAVITSRPHSAEEKEHLPEVLQTAPAVPRDPHGRFAGQGFPPELASKQTSLNRVSRLIKNELANYLGEDPIGRNPLIILAKIASNESYHPSLRCSAADRLARYLAPRLMNIELEQPDQQFDVETTRIRATLRSTLGLPALKEE